MSFFLSGAGTLTGPALNRTHWEHCTWVATTMARAVSRVCGCECLGSVGYPCTTACGGDIGGIGEFPTVGVAKTRYSKAFYDSLAVGSIHSPI